MVELSGIRCLFLDAFSFVLPVSMFWRFVVVLCKKKKLAKKSGAANPFFGGALSRALPFQLSFRNK